MASGSITRSARAVAAVAAIMGVVAAPAAATHSPKPVPGCYGFAAQDPAGDFTNPAQFPTGPNMDVKGLFFLTNDRNQTSANIVVDNLTEEVPLPYTTVNWYAAWTGADGTVKFVKAALDRLDGIVSYSYGTKDGSIYFEDGETFGHTWLGADGVIQIRIPGEIARSGATLMAPYVEISGGMTIPMVGGTLHNRDRADGDDYVVQPCPVA